MPNWKKLITSGSDASLSTLTINNSGSTADSLTITATEDSSAAAPVITLKRNSNSPADADYIGQIKFKGENDADQEVVYAKITGKINDASDGSEDGNIEFANRRGGLNVITARLSSDKLQLLNGTDFEVDGGSISGSTYYGDGSNLTGINASIVSSSTVSDTFTSVTAYTASHAFGTKDVIVNVYDDNDRMVIPQEITTLSTTSVGIDFGTSVTGRVVIGKAGHIVSGSVVADVDFTSVSSSILPHTTEVFDLGSSANRWRDLYLSGSTIDLGGTKITRDTATGDIEFKDSGDNRKSLKVDVLTIGSGANQRKIQVSNGKVRFTDTSDTHEDTETTHILPAATDTYDLGSPTRQWRDLYLSSASLYIDGQKVLSSTSDTLTFTTDAGQSIKLLETGADDIILQTDTGNIELKGTVEVLTGKKITDSAGSVIRFGNSIGITGSIETTGTVDGIDLQAFSSSVATSLSNVASDWDSVTNKPAGIVSSSAQITSLTSYTETFTSQTAVTASHSLGTKNVTVSIYGSDDYMVFPTSIKTHDTNNVYVQFNSSRSGRIVITK